MAEKKWIIILAIVDVFVLAGLIFWYVKQDREAPVISLREVFSYEEDMAAEEILSYVKAVDGKDGDVSHTLVIEKIGPDASGERALITCGAMDSSRNMAKYSFYVDCEGEAFDTVNVAQGTDGTFELAVGEAAILADDHISRPDSTEAASEEQAEQETTSEEETPEDEIEDNDSEGTHGEIANRVETPENGEDTENTQNSTPVANEQPTPTPPAEEQPAPTPQPTPQAEEQPTGAAAPVIQFSTSEVKTIQGRNPAWVTVISQMSDDVDNYETLLKSLTISGDYNNAVPGSYDVSVTVTDSLGNVSAPSRIRIVVE